MEYRRNTRQGQQDTEDLLTIRLPPQPSLVLALFHRLCVCDIILSIYTVFAVVVYYIFKICVIIIPKIIFCQIHMDMQHANSNSTYTAIAAVYVSRYHMTAHNGPGWSAALMRARATLNFSTVIYIYSWFVFL